jgi:prepilin-type N-terminal cleavage/methylation domain-containing protein
MKTNNRTHRGFTLVELLVVIVIIAALAGLTAPMVIRQRKKADQTEAVNNARQIGLALFEFETEYGTFPDSATATAVTAATGQPVTDASDANAKFRQLIAAGIAQSEAMFYAKTAFTKKPDGVIDPIATEALKQGEVGFGMLIRADNTGLSAAGNPARPILGAPFKIDMSGKFDPDFYDGKAVILKLDNSVTSLNIVKSGNDAGEVLLNGKKLLDNTTGSVWAPDPAPVWAFPTKK